MHPFTPVRLAIEVGRAHGDPAWDRIAADEHIIKLHLAPTDVELAYACYARHAEGPGPWGGAWCLNGHTLFYRDRGDFSALDVCITGTSADLILGNGHTTILHLAWERHFLTEFGLTDVFVDRTLLQRHGANYGSADLADPIYRLMALDNRLDRRLAQQLYAAGRHGVPYESRWAETAKVHPECFGKEAARALGALLWRWHVRDDELVGGRMRALLPLPPAPAELRLAD
jgi:hypothetical protein